MGVTPIGGLTKGTHKTTDKPLIVLDVLGSGGQGTVYKVTYDGKPYALKVLCAYKKPEVQSLRKQIENVIRIGSPSDKFCWPSMLIDFDARRRTVAFLMPLLPSGYIMFQKILRNQIKPSITLRIALAICIQLVTHMRELHKKGCSYRDVNPGGFAVNPLNGDVIVMDVDNVSNAGSFDLHNGKVLVYPGYGAPEAVDFMTNPDKNKTPITCSALTDLHGLAVLLYQLLLRVHPFHGAVREKLNVMDEKADRLIYGLTAQFVHDPKTHTNTVSKEALDNWLRLPKPLRDAFTRTFTDGVKTPATRTTELAFLQVLHETISTVFSCVHCHGEQYFVHERYVNSKYKCSLCGKDTTLPLALCCENRFSFIDVGPTISSFLISKDISQTGPFAVVSKHPTKPDLFGLQNLSDTPWEIVAEGTASPTVIPPQKSTRLLGSLKFKTSTGKIVCIKHGDEFFKFMEGLGGKNS